MEKLSEVNGVVEPSKIQLQVNYETLADLFFYPQNEEYKNNIKNIHSYLSKDIPEAANAMQPFIDFIEVATIQEMQELFLRSLTYRLSLLWILVLCYLVKIINGVNY
ncbi:MAG: hypothetical protein IPG60_03825 [Bacteroidetes bacterium]|nr:hypothetical protein [Bacteroidota bacterium]